MVFPIYFSYGIIFWISILFVWGLELFNYCSNSNQPVWTFLFMNYILYTFEKRNNCYSFIVKWNFQYFFRIQKSLQVEKPKATYDHYQKPKVKISVIRSTKDLTEPKPLKITIVVPEVMTLWSKEIRLLPNLPLIIKFQLLLQLTLVVCIFIKIIIITRFIFIIQNYVGKIIP